jgi:hypothetical protein
MKSEQEIREELEFWQKELQKGRQRSELLWAEKKYEQCFVNDDLMIDYNEKCRLLKWVLGELKEGEK